MADTAKQKALNSDPQPPGDGGGIESPAPGVPTSGADPSPSPYELPPSTGAPGGGDRPPDSAKKRPGRPKGSKTKARADRAPTGEASDLRRLRKKLTGLLGGPALAFEAIGEDWPKQHVDRQAPILADAIIEVAKDNAQLRARLEAFLEGGTTAQLIMAGAMYVIPIGIYFNMIPAPERVRLMLNIPERNAAIITGPGGIAIPDEVRKQVESEAIAAGFVDAFGNADIDAYIRATREATEGVRGPASNGG